LRIDAFYDFVPDRAEESAAMTQPTRTTLAEAAAAPLRDGRLSSRWFEGDGIEIRHYAPKGEDRQIPHDRDEFYFVISGRGTYIRGSERVRFGPGDMLFAAAGDEHRFAEFSDDFATWVLFYGPQKT
jgi:mannose-6-phosphate isomerase-like protein (cupin superfamily)